MLGAYLFARIGFRLPYQVSSYAVSRLLNIIDLFYSRSLNSVFRRPRGLYFYQEMKQEVSQVALLRSMYPFQPCKPNISNYPSKILHNFPGMSLKSFLSSSKILEKWFDRN